MMNNLTFAHRVHNITHYVFLWPVMYLFIFLALPFAYLSDALSRWVWRLEKDEKEKLAV